MRSHLPRYALAVLAAVGAVLAAGCGGSGGSPPTVPSLSRTASGGQAPSGQGQGGQVASGSGAARATALHAAAQCIRQHGIPRYSDPVLTPGGAVYSDSRRFQYASLSVVNAVHQACGTLMTRAGLNPESEPPAPPRLVQAGVRAAECLRANGMPDVTDPTAQSPYTPGHGFLLTGGAFPPGGKASPVYKHARQACDIQVTAELRASTLGSLRGDG